MAFSQRAQFTASPTWVATGNLSATPNTPQAGIAYGSARMRLEGSTEVDSISRGIKMDVSGEMLAMFPDLSPSKQYRVTIEEVTP
jgi:hypothetical protein